MCEGEKHILRMCVCVVANETRAILQSMKYWTTNMAIVEHACPTTPMTRGLRERPLPKTIRTYSIVYSTQQWVKILKSTIVKINFTLVVIVKKWVVWKQFH
jgi:hypothetical protein